MYRFSVLLLYLLCLNFDFKSLYKAYVFKKIDFTPSNNLEKYTYYYAQHLWINLVRHN